MSKKKVKKVEAEVKIEEPKVEEIKIEETTILVCPENACGDLEFAWAKGIFGVYDVNSKTCRACFKDFPATAEICKAGTVAKVEAKKAAKKAVVTPRGKGEKMLWLEGMIAEGTHTRKQLIDQYVEKFGGSALTPMTALSDGKNPKYNKFSKLIVAKENGILAFA